MECPNDEELRAWLDGGCDEATALGLEAHLDQCGDCQTLVATVVRLEIPAGDRSASTPMLRPGESLGRYRILDVLGAGAMGVVYAAHDGTLDRTIAVKLLRSGRVTSAEATERLAREAQAMARLSHPNVVAVHEIGAHDGAPFVAMEHVDGVTLSEWLRERSPKIDEIVRVFREAAIGLHAVHRAGLVHRDFKPGNVLVSGDGRVRIADFGLVHRPAGAAAAPLEGDDPAMSRATADGAVIGTPAYLAPEQLEGRADARSDQFSLCVAMFEACFGQRPFQGATLGEIAAAVRTGAIRLPKVLPHGTRWLIPILRRGLAYDPSARFADLGALVAALSRTPARKRRWAFVGASVLAGASGVLFGVHTARGPAPDCATVEQALAGIWDAPRRTSIRAAFMSKDVPRAAQAWEKVSTALDAYAAEWVGRRRDACLHPGKDEAARGLVAARVACLDRRVAELRVLSELLASSDVATENAPQAVAELRSPDSCERDGAGVTDVSADEQVVLERFTEVRLLFLVGRYKAALELARKVLPASERARPAIHAQALLRSGQLELTRSLDVGITQLRQAALLAETAHDDETRAEALTYLAYAMSQLTAPSDLALGEQYADQATAVLARLGGDRHLDPIVLISRGLLLRATERYDEAVAQLERALTLLDHDPAHDTRQVGRVLAALGTTLAEMGRPGDAVPHFERALTLTEASLGSRSPALFPCLVNLGQALLESGRPSEAAPHLERAAALAELGDSPDSRTGATAALILGKCRAELGDAAAARHLLERALAISAGLAPGDRLRFEIRLALGQHLARSGEAAQSRALLEQALRDGGPGEEQTAEARFALAQALPRAERKRARELARKARETYGRAGPRRDKEVAAIDAWLGKD